MAKRTLQFICILLFAITIKAQAQASLTIENNSKRLMTVKVMEKDGGNGTLYTTVTIQPYSSEVVNFSESGYYFTKSKAVLKGKDPVYRKGDSFKVVNDDSGYSVLTLTFSIVESKMPKASGGKSISKKEFEDN